MNRLACMGLVALLCACGDDEGSATASDTESTTVETSDPTDVTMAENDTSATSDETTVTTTATTTTATTSDETTSDDTTMTDEAGSSSGTESIGTESSSGAESSSGTESSNGTESSSSGSGESETTANEESSSSETAACQPLTDDTSALGQACMNDLDCPEGYTCFDAGGIVAQPLCHILCEMDCECPDGYSCVEQNIKGNMFSECLQ